MVTVYYNINSSELQGKDRVVLKAVAKAIKANKDTKYVITGYADSETGTAAFNAKLRKARAERVYDALVSYGVSPISWNKRPAMRNSIVSVLIFSIVQQRFLLRSDN